MPTSPLALCVVTGCPNLVASGRCTDHRREARRDSDTRRPTSHARGYDGAWRATRSAYLEGHPYCEHPGCGEPATDVDHLDGMGPRGTHGHDFRNLQALCHPHHSSKTARQDGGFGRGAWG